MTRIRTLLSALLCFTLAACGTSAPDDAIGDEGDLPLNPALIPENAYGAVPASATALDGQAFAALLDSGEAALETANAKDEDWADHQAWLRPRR